MRKSRYTLFTWFIPRSKVRFHSFIRKIFWIRSNTTFYPWSLVGISRSLTKSIFVRVAGIIFQHCPIIGVPQVLIHGYRILVADSNEQVDKIAIFPESDRGEYKLYCVKLSRKTSSYKRSQKKLNINFTFPRCSPKTSSEQQRHPSVDILAKLSKPSHGRANLLLCLQLFPLLRKYIAK